MSQRSDVRRDDPPRGAQGDPDRLDPRDRTVITVLLVSAFVVILNETIMSVALPVLMEDLNVSGRVPELVAHCCE